MTETRAPVPGERVSGWGYSFTWTADHLPRETTDPLRYQYDTLGAAALERLQAIRSTAVEESKAKGTPMPSNDLYALLRDNRANDEVLSRFWDDTHTVPDWVDWEQLARGQKSFYRYILANVVGFALQGFIAENSAVPGVIEVLVRTGGFSTRTLLGRLLETFQWLIQVTHDLESIKPGGEGHVATLRVRLLHSSVRRRILKLVESKPSYFDTEKYGIPVNTLDSIHSITTFSCNPMWLQLPKLGVQPSATEIDDYVALFRYLAHVIGAPTEYFVDANTAKLTMESMLVHELRTTETSRVVAYNFMQCVGNLPSPFHVSMGFLRAGSRWANGNEMCDELDIGGAGVFEYMIWFGFCLLVTVMPWLQWLIPGLDETVIAYSRKRLYDGIVNRKSKTLFEFKYVPQMGKTTGRERHESAGSEKQDWMRNLPILSSVASLTDIGHFEMVCLVVGAIAGAIASWGVLLIGRWVLEVHPTVFASYASVAGPV